METDAIMPRRRDMPSRNIGNEVLVREPEGGKVHFLNGTAALIWECCDGSTSLAECERRVRESFSVPDGVDLPADIGETLADFRAKGLLDEPGSNA